jgi:hypothetical protein
MQRRPRPLVTARPAMRRPTLLLAGRIDALRRRLRAHGRTASANGRRFAALPPIERVMRRLAAAAAHTAVTRVHVHQAFSASSHWTLRQVRAQRGPVRSPATFVRSEVLRERLVQQRHLLRERVERRDAMPVTHLSLHAPAITRVEQRQVFPRVQLTLLRAGLAASPARMREPADTEPGMRAAARTQAPAVTRDPAPPALAPHELSRITDHVVHALDRRALSWRERSGRI